MLRRRVFSGQYDLHASIDNRRQRLLACGYCRLIWDLLTDERSRRAVEVAERFADGQASREELDQARAAAEQAYRNGAPGAPALAADQRFFVPGNVASRAAARRADSKAGILPWRDAFGAERERQYDLVCDLVRESPSTPLVIRPEWVRWRDGTALKMARAIYEGGDFGAVPILADALEEAGCDSAEILTHCRTHPVHVRGCWVLDALLGKQ